MCEICHSTKEDFVFKNGNDYLSTGTLYKVYKGKTASIRLCHVHSIELFQKGEKRFLKSYLNYALKLAGRMKTHEDEDMKSSLFGL